MFYFVFIFLMVLVCAGDLIPSVKEGEQYTWKDLLKLMLFVGIIALLMGTFS